MEVEGWWVLKLEVAISCGASRSVSLEWNLTKSGKRRGRREEGGKKRLSGCSLSSLLCLEESSHCWQES